ncbi:MAG: TetR/AcrR family transcriptional regulator [Candidatus Binatia bacterium]
MAELVRAGRGENGRRELMDIAIDCFARYGYQGASIDRIAKAAGLTKGAIYYHFKDKEALLFAAVQNRVSQFERRVARDLAMVEDAATALRRVTEVCLEHATRTNHRRLIVTLMVEALDTNAELSAQFRDMMRRFRATLADIIEIGQRRGAFRADVAAATAAGVYAGAVMGAEIQYYQDPERIDLGAHLHAFLDGYLGWLAAPKPRSRRTPPW